MLRKIDTVFVKATSPLTKRAPESGDLELLAGDVMPCDWMDERGTYWTSADVDAAKIFDPERDAVTVVPASAEMWALYHEQAERRYALWRKRRGL